MNPNQLIREDPQFGFFLTAVMTELTGMTAEEWIYECWKAHVTGLTPAQFIADWSGENDAKDTNSL
jgi:hypothetical protein